MRERERERERVRERERGHKNSRRKIKRESERLRVCAWVQVPVRLRERETVRECVCVSVCVRETERERECRESQSKFQLSLAAVEACEWSTSLQPNFFFATNASKLIRTFRAKIRTWVGRIKNSWFVARLSISTFKVQLTNKVSALIGFHARNGKVVGQKAFATWQSLYVWVLELCPDH